MSRLPTDCPSLQNGNGYLPQQRPQQRPQQQQFNYSMAFSSDDYNQIMSSNIGSVLPSRDSVAGFLDNPGGLLDIGNDKNASNFFDQGSCNKSFEVSQQNFFQDFGMQDAFRPECQFDNNMDVMQQKIHLGRLSKTSHTQALLAPDISKSSPSPSSSRSDLFSMPDPFSLPIDDDLFGDDHSLPLKSNKLKEGPKRVTSTPQVSTLATPAPSLLHQACYLYPTTFAVVNSALGIDKTNLRRRIATSASTTAKAATAHNSNKRQRRPESFSLPLHIAVDQGGSLEVLRTLAELAPDVIVMTDGPESCNAIAAHLSKKHHNLGIISMLIQTNPEALRGIDRYKNTCLHVACSKGAPLEIVELIYSHYENALKMKNFHGQSPLDVAQRTSICPLNVIDFIQELVLHPLERDANHLVDSDIDV